MFFIFGINMRILHSIVAFTALFFTSFFGLNGQNLSDNEAFLKANALHNEYRFNDAKAIYDSILKVTTDSIQIQQLNKMIIQCENGIGLVEYLYRPNVIAKKNVALSDFYLYYSDLKDSSWVKNPNPFVNGEHPIYSAIYAPVSHSEYYFAQPDKSGSWNINHSTFNDTTWNAPAMLNEENTSIGDEIFPLVSNDGSKLYFSSNALFGMGGYDIYMCEWDESTNDWGAPTNLGFPFSSPADDFLFMNTSDGNYSIFSSNRDCAKDSITIYVLQFDNLPIREANPSYEDIVECAKLDVTKSDNESKSADNQDNIDEGDELYTKYLNVMAQYRELQSEIKKVETEQSENREQYIATEDANILKELETKLLDNDLKIFSLQQSLGELSNTIQSIEMDFIAQGMIFDADDFDEEEENVEQQQDFQFVKHSFSENRSFVVNEPEVIFDYSFKIGEEAQFALDNTLPEGLIYQIKFVTLTSKGSLERFKGLSPVYENRINSRKYIYNVGLFYSYHEALDQLNVVRRLGFSSAAIVAYNSGESISIQNARKLEKMIKENAKYRVVISQYDDRLPAEILSVIQSMSDKDIAKVVEQGKTYYIIAPFNSESDAKELTDALVNAGADETIYQIIK